MSVFSKILRAGEGKKVRALSAIVPEIGALEPDMEALSDEDLKHKTVEFREQVDRAGKEKEQEALNDLLVEAFAVAREGARRTLGQRHFDVQLMGGAALHFGWIAEMKTGEGKTLTSTLPLYLNGLTGRGCHLVTVNDYLASYHAELMGRLYTWLGLTVGLVGPHTDEPVAKKAAYLADITYGTNTEFGFDYLRDNMAYSRDRMAQRGFVYGIVDEVDSILIDEARTPLIISGPAMESAKLYQQFSAVVRSLKRDEDYEVDEEKRTVAPSEEGIGRVERMLGVDNLYDLVSQNLVHQLTQALRAKELYKRDKDYIVADGEVKIVDEFTGRILDGRRWSDGLHQAVEAKERVRIKEENHTWATVTLQNYFRMYEKLAGMTGTAETEASEFANTYNLPVVPIPTHRPMIRVDEPDLIYKSELSKFEAAIEDIKERHDAGQPVLVGTASVEKSEQLATMLRKEGIPHTVLNAKQHEREALVIAQAGRLHAVTVATNMAGRGVDIILGGNPEMLADQEARSQGLDLETDEGKAALIELEKRFAEECKVENEKVIELGGLYVLGSERHESRRIDNQLRGRSGRQGDPGESRFFLSLEDELMRLFATGAMSWVMSRALPDDEAIEAKMVTKAIEKAQNTVETRNAEIRKDVLKYDEVMNEQRKVIYAKRMRVIDGEDLRSHLLEVLDSALSDVVESYCPEDVEDWNLDGLLAEAKLYYPSKFTVGDLSEAVAREQIHESLLAEATEYYEQRELSVEGGPDTMREVERQVMLQLIDQKWREHLSEMDYLREGIGLRAMGQQDPLVAWQKEGYAMFGNLISNIDDDFVKYSMHVDVVIERPEEPDLSLASLEGPAEPVQSLGGSEAAHREAAHVAQAAQDEGGPPPAAAPVDDGETMQPKVKSEHEKVGRNDPCWCGSGKKYKHCHGR
jgi:preprotein translocase subunit SecA